MGNKSSKKKTDQKKAQDYPDPKVYMWPEEGDWASVKEHSEDVLVVFPISAACTPVMMLAKECGLPVDFCGINYQTDLNGKVALALNPIHSAPFLLVFENGDPQPAYAINDSLAIINYLAVKYANMIPDHVLPVEAGPRGKVMEKTQFINGVLYRSTAYQYIYPLIGLMTECQYDISKRDFAMEIVDKWCADSGSAFLSGKDKPGYADFALAAIHGTNCWTRDESFNVAIKWERDLLPKYPNMKKCIDALLEYPAIKEVRNVTIGDPQVTNCPSTETWTNFVAKQAMGNEMPADGRMFKFDAEKIPHPNWLLAPGMEETRKLFDMPIKSQLDKAEEEEKKELAELEAADHVNEDSKANLAGLLAKKHAHHEQHDKAEKEEKEELAELEAADHVNEDSKANLAGLLAKKHAHHEQHDKDEKEEKKELAELEAADHVNEDSKANLAELLAKKHVS